MRLQWGRGELLVDADGTARLGASGPSIGFRPPSVEADGEGFSPIGWSPSAVAVAGGEVESSSMARGLDWLVRHHVLGDAWNVRAVLTGAHGTTVGSAEVVVAGGAGASWVWAAGSAALVVLVDDPGHPVALRLRRGRLFPPDPRARGHGRYEWLEGGAALDQPSVVELTARRYDSWADVHALLPAWLPVLALPDSDELLLQLPDDSVTGPGVVSAGEGGVVVRGHGRVRLRVEGVSGHLVLDADLAPVIEEPLWIAAGRIVGRTGQGMAADATTEALAAALLILVASGRSDTDAFDLICGELVERPDQHPLRTVALARAAVADPDPATRNSLIDALGHLSGPEARTVLKAVLRAALWSPRLTELVLGAAPRQPDAGEEAEVLAARLGAGLPGEGAPYDAVAAARDIACLAGTDTTLDPAVWPVPAATIVEQGTRRLLSTWNGDEQVVAWLLVAGAAGWQGE